jgi:anti-anti-sigma regulatory factor
VASDGPARSPSPTDVNTDVVVLRELADAATTSAWCALVRSLLLDSTTRVVTCDIGQLSGRAASIIDALARMQLTARRCGGVIRLRRADPALVELLELVGLADVLGVCDRSDLAGRRGPEDSPSGSPGTVESRGDDEPEHGEEPHI